MNKYTYLALFSLNVMLFLTTPVENYNNGWYYKIAFVNVASFFLMYSMFYNNYFIDNYLLWILLALNIIVLISLILKYYPGNKLLDNMNILLLIGLSIYILLNRQSLLFNKGKLINPSKNLLYIHIAALCIFYITFDTKITTTIIGRLVCIANILIPLLFPLEDYFIYRVILLHTVMSVNWKFKLGDKLN